MYRTHLLLDDTGAIPYVVQETATSEFAPDRPCAIRVHVREQAGVVVLIPCGDVGHLQYVPCSLRDVFAPRITKTVFTLRVDGDTSTSPPFTMLHVELNSYMGRCNSALQNREVIVFQRVPRAGIDHHKACCPAG